MPAGLSDLDATVAIAFHVHRHRRGSAAGVSLLTVELQNLRCRQPSPVAARQGPMWRPRGWGLGPDSSAQFIMSPPTLQSARCWEVSRPIGLPNSRFAPLSAPPATLTASDGIHRLRWRDEFAKHPDSIDGGAMSDAAMTVVQDR